MGQTRLARMCVLAAVAAVLPLPGCRGDETDETTSDMKAVAKVMSALDSASREGDGELICRRLFTPKLENSVRTSAASGKCAAEVRSKLFSPNAKIRVQSIDVANGENASALVEENNGNTSRLFLVKHDGEWRIRSVAPA